MLPQLSSPHTVLQVRSLSKRFGALLAVDHLSLEVQREARRRGAELLEARGANGGKMGLSLAICKALVAAQGGTIPAESGGKRQGARMVIAF